MAETTPAPTHSPSGTAVGVSWVNGRLLAPGEAAVRADDHAVVVGDGVWLWPVRWFQIQIFSF